MNTAIEAVYPRMSAVAGGPVLATNSEAQPRFTAARIFFATVAGNHGLDLLAGLGDSFWPPSGLVPS